MSATYAKSRWFSRSVKSIVLGLAVVTIVAAFNIGSAEARHRRGHSSKYNKTPMGKVMKYRPALQVPYQG